MAINSLTGYKGSPLSDKHRKFLDKLVRRGLSYKVTSKTSEADTGKTIQILRDGQKLAYINDTVVKKGDALIGYHFRDQPRPSDACPHEWSCELLSKWASERFACDPDHDIYIDKREGNSYNSRRKFLLIKSASVAFRALEIEEGDMDNVSSSGGSPHIEVVSPVAEAGAGFGDPVENRIVEQAAVQAVTKDYERNGWSVRPVEQDKCGFDLECSKNDEFEHVEVKGVSGTELCFIITKGEDEQALKDDKFVLAVVTSALSTSPKLTKFSGVEYDQRFHRTPIQYRAVLKR